MLIVCYLYLWQLGMTEKHLISGSLSANESPMDLLFADTSGSNTTSTDFFSEDSNDQARRNVMDGANSRLASSTDEARRSVMDGANSRLASSTDEARRSIKDGENIRLASSNEEARRNVMDSANLRLVSSRNDEARHNVMDSGSISLNSSSDSQVLYLLNLCLGFQASSP